MKTEPQGIITSTAERPRDSWPDPERGNVSWFTLFSSDITPTHSLGAGVAEIEQGGSLELHRHDEPEVYYILEGTGIMSINGVETAVSPGSAVYIPGNAEHGIRNEKPPLLRLFYTFPIDCFADVKYRFSKNQGGS